MLSHVCLPRFGFCVLDFLSILSGFLSREKLTQKCQEPKAEQIAELQLLNDTIDQNTNLPNFQLPNISVNVLAQVQRRF